MREPPFIRACGNAPTFPSTRRSGIRLDVDSVAEIRIGRGEAKETEGLLTTGSIEQPVDRRRLRTDAGSAA